VWRVMRWVLLFAALCLAIVALSHSIGLLTLIPLLALWWIPIRPQINLDLDWELVWLLDD